MTNLGRAKTLHDQLLGRSVKARGLVINRVSLRRHAARPPPEGDASNADPVNFALYLWADFHFRESPAPFFPGLCQVFLTFSSATPPLDGGYF